MGDSVNKRTVAVLLVVAVVLSVVATWKVLTSPSQVTYLGPSQGAKVSLSVVDEGSVVSSSVPSRVEGSGVSMEVKQNQG